MQQNFFVVFGIATGLYCVPATAQEIAAEPATVNALIISGGSSHDFQIQTEILKAGIQERTQAKINWTVFFDESGRSDAKVPLLTNDQWAAPFDIVIHHHCFTRVADPVYIDQILKPHRDGLPALILHSSLFSFPTGEGHWGELCGIKGVSHFPEATVSVATSGTESDLMKGIDSWESPREELYRIESLVPNATVLAEAFIAGNSERQPSVWTHEYGAARARIFVTSLGNDSAGLRIPEYLDAVSRGFLWALGKPLETDHLKITPGDSLSELSGESEKRSFFHTGRSVISEGTAIAMSEDVANGSLAQNAIDGECETFWRSSSSGPSVWEVTLSDPVEMSALAVEWEAFQPKSYHIEGSLDLLEWSTLARGGVADIETRRSLYHFPRESVRSIRISFPVTRPGEHPGIREVSAYSERSQIPSALVYEAGLNDGLRAVSHRGLSSLLRVHPEWDVLPGLTLLPPGINPVERVRCADLSSFILARTGDDTRSVFRLSEDEALASDANVFVSDLSDGSSITWDGEWLYVLEELQLTKLRDTNGDGVADERHRLGTVLHPENGIVNVRHLQLGIDGWIYAILESENQVMGTDLAGRPVTLPAHGIVRFERDGSSFQLFVSSLQPVTELRSLGELSFAVVTRSEEGEPNSRFLQYGVFPGRPLESFPRLSRQHIQLETKGEFVYSAGLGLDPHLIGQVEGLRSVFHDEDTVMAVIEHPKGSALIRMGRKGTPTNAEAIVLDELNDLELFPLLSASCHVLRKEAVFEILRRKRDWQAEAEALLQDRKSTSYLPSLALLSQMKGTKTFELLVDAARLSHQAGAYRLLGDRAEAENHRIFGEITKAKDPSVTTEILAAIARSDSDIAGLDELVLSFAAVDNEELSRTAKEWLIQRDATAVCFAALEDGNDSTRRRAALAVLSRIPKATVAEGLVLRLEQTGEHEFRLEGLAALCDLYFVKGQQWTGTPLIDSFLRASLTDRRVDTAWLLDHILESGIPVSDLEELVHASKNQLPLQAATVALMLEQENVPAAANPWLNSLIDESSHDPNLRARALALVIGEMDFKIAFQKAAELLEQSLVHPAREALLSAWKKRPDLKQHKDAFRRHLKIPARGQAQLARFSLEAIGVHELPAVSSSESELDEYELGFKVFQSQGCYQCHNIHGEGASIGPDLVEWLKNASDEAFEKAVRNPDARITKPFRPEIFELNNGTRLKGLIQSTSGDSVRIADQAGNLVTLATKDIQSRTAEKDALMPCYSEARVSRPEMDAMIHFLRKLGKPSLAE